jgi:GPH family glycoside/pentoside/hexuronide:cation symporter
MRTKLGFGVGDLGGNLFFTVISFWALNYLTDTVGLAAAGAGAALMTGKLWDAFVDPVVGMMSDRTRTRWGRRRPYLLWGALPLGAAMALFFAAPPLSDQVALFWWALLVFALLNTAYSFVNVPYSSLTPELTPDYNERMTLNGYRFGFAVIGTILGAALVQPILGFFPGDKKAGFLAVGVLFGATIAITALATAFSVREKPAAAGESVSVWKSWAGVWKNRPYRIILGAYTLHLLGITFLSGMLIYYFKYVLHNEAGTTMAMLLLLVVAMVFIPVSVLFSKKFGKVRTYQVALVVLAAAALTVWLFGASSGTEFVLVVMTGAGLGMGFSYAPPFALVPDTIEVEARKTGRREEGAYYGLWNFAIKLCQAGGAAGSGLVLAWAGYVANQTDQGASALAAIGALIGPVPAFFFLAATLLLTRYPLDEKTYREAIG